MTLPTLLDTLGSDFLSLSYAVFTALVTFWESPSRTKLPRAHCESLVRCWKHVSWAEKRRFMISRSLQLIIRTFIVLAYRYDDFFIWAYESVAAFLRSGPHSFTCAVPMQILLGAELDAAPHSTLTIC